MAAEKPPIPNTLNQLVKDDLSLLSEMLDEDAQSNDPFIDDRLETDSLRGKMMTNIIEALAVFAGSQTEEQRQLVHYAAHFAVTVARLEQWKLEEERYVGAYLRDVMVQLQPLGLSKIRERLLEDTTAYMQQNPDLEILTIAYAPCLADSDQDRHLCRSVMQTMFMMIDMDMTQRAADVETIEKMQHELDDWNGLLDEGLL